MQDSLRDLILTVYPSKSNSLERPTNRCGHSFTIVNNSAYVFGGAGAEFISGDFFAADIIQMNWKQVHLDGFHIPGCLFGHSTIAYRNRIYLFGGLCQTQTYEFKNAPDTFGAGSDDDENETPSAAEPNSFFNSQFKEYDTLSFKDRLFARPRDQECSRELFVFDCATKQWAVPKISGDAPSARYFHSACLLKNMMIVFGGCTNSGYQDSRNDLYALNLDTFEWKKLSGSGKVPSPRHGHSMTMIGDSKVALFGGAIEQVGRDGKPMITRYNDLYVYDIQTNEWSVGEAGGSPPNPRVFHSAALIEKRLWIFGGECDISQTDLTILDIESMRWKRPLYDGIFTHTLQAADTLSNKLCVFGGLSTTQGLLDEMLMLNVVSVKGKANESTFKIVLAGDSGVGKSGLMTRFVDDSFTFDHTATVGLDFKTLNVLIEGRVFKLHVWDTAGQERFQALTANYYKGAQAAVIVYDVTNRHSFERVLSWVESIDEANPGSSVAKLLVGNKADLESQRQVTTKSGAELAKKINATFVETSAKNTFNVDAAFLNLAKSLVIGKPSSTVQNPTSSSATGVHLDRHSQVGGIGEPRKCC